MELLRTYYRLTKPGIIYGNAMTAGAGFLLASQGDIDLGKLAATLAGISLVVGAGCVVNNCIDRGIDSKMARTKSRSTAAGLVSNRQALPYAAGLALAGAGFLAVWTNWLTIAVGLTGFFFYVVLYSLGKRRSKYGTLVGSVSGATPPLAGYTAASGHLDSAAGLIFLIMVAWQMAHFYAIAIYRLEDYKAADLPVWPAVKGVPAAKRQIWLYIVAFTVLTPLLTVYGYTGPAYAAVVVLLGLAWLGKGIAGANTDDRLWARRMFLFSLIVITVWSVALGLDASLG